MITANISLVLYIIGAITSIPLLQFLFPSFYGGTVMGYNIERPEHKFYFAHWGLLVVCLCILMFWAAQEPIMQRPVIIAVMLEKAVLAIWVFVDRKKPYTKALLPSAVFDTLCCVVFALFLLGY